MRAIVMTYDRNRPYTQHMMARYEALWPDHPFVFRVPFQDAANPPNRRAEYVHTPSAITPTVLALLADLPDDEWIYWAIDDKYPLHLNLPAVQRITEWIPKIEDTSISGVLFCRVRNLLSSDFLSGDTLSGPDGELFLERTTYQQIWIHQFLRVKVLRHLFENMPQEPIDREGAAVMDQLKKKVARPPDHRLFVTSRNLAAFGESTSGGKITDNCYDSMKKCGIPPPPQVARLGRSLTMGGETFRTKSLLRWLPWWRETSAL
jgi:hypothetical protein